MERVLMTRAGYLYLLHIAPRVDKLVIPRTKGQLSSAGIDKVGLITTTGAKSGQSRTQPLAFFEDSEGLIAIASNYGHPKHPAWSANLLAHPNHAENGPSH